MTTATEHPPIEAFAEDFARINTLSREHGQAGLLAPTVIRYGPGASCGPWFLMNRQADGWSSSCWFYASIAACANHWRFEITGIGRDNCGPFLFVVPIHTEPRSLI